MLALIRPKTPLLTWEQAAQALSLVSMGRVSESTEMPHVADSEIQVHVPLIVGHHSESDDSERDDYDSKEWLQTIVTLLWDSYSGVYSL